MKLASGRSSRWAFMEKFEVPDYDHPERNYLTRWRIVQTPWCGLYLHRLDGPDPRPTYHDHPYGFVSIILRGGYTEKRLNPMTLGRVTKRRRWLNVMRKIDAHYISELMRTPTWTLLLVGRRSRIWGYVEPAPYPGGWWWTAFDQHTYAKDFDQALARRRAH